MIDGLKCSKIETGRVHFFRNPEGDAMQWLQNQTEGHCSRNSGPVDFDKSNMPWLNAGIKMASYYLSIVDMD